MRCPVSLCPNHRPRNRRPCRLGWLGPLIAVVVGTSAAFPSAQGRTATRPDARVDVRVYAEPALARPVMGTDRPAIQTQAMQSISTSELPGMPPAAAIVVRTPGSVPKRPRNTSFIAA